jgi:hypothetical protein
VGGGPDGREHLEGFVSTAFIVDAFSSMFAGWRVSPSLHAQLVLAAPEMAL